MRLGNHLFHARKKSGLSQEAVAEKLGVSRQTISKWETDETLPDIRQAKRMATLYHVSLDELIDFDWDVQEIQAVIEQTDTAVQEKIDWTNVWSKQYPVLKTYWESVNVPYYARQLALLLDELETEYALNTQDAMLVLKDILYHVWKERKKEG